MGTWNDGLLDNDTAMDGLGELGQEIAEDVVNLGEETPSPETTATLGAAVGVLLQLSAYAFDPETESGPAIVAALRGHEAEIAKMPAEARAVLEAVLAGKGAELAERRAALPAEHVTLLNREASRAPFGARETSLFASPAGARYVQSVVDRCIEMLDEDFEDDSMWSDLCREAPSMGALAALLVLEPAALPHAELASFREKAREGLATLGESPDDEIDFQRGYYANLDAVFGLLEARAAK